MYKNKVLIDLLSEMFGFPRSYSHNLVEVDFNCPICDGGRNKFNLGVNTVKKLFHCWSCDYRGGLEYLISKHGSARQLEKYSEVLLYLARERLSSKYTDKTLDSEHLNLGSFRSLKTSWADSLHYRAAMNYLNTRKISGDIIKEWDICYSEDGKYKNRIIIPSKSESGQLEYFVARAFYDSVVPKYRNPSVSKQSIIFGEKFIDWKKPVILVEGVFDAIVLYNSIPLLGTKIKSNTKLMKKLIENKSRIILALDFDKVGRDKTIELGKYLTGFGLSVKVLYSLTHKDLSEVFQKVGRRGIIDLFKLAKDFDELSLSIERIK